MGTDSDLVDILCRWENAGGHWKLLRENRDQLEFGLFTCDGGEQMSRVTGVRTQALETFRAGRLRSDD